jgi:hypothetical protein
MKKIMFLPLLLGMVVVNAQIQLGVKAGVNIANFTGGDFNNIEKSPLTSFHVGGILRWKFEHLILQGEVYTLNKEPNWTMALLNMITKFLTSMYLYCSNMHLKVVFTWRPVRR